MITRRSFFRQSAGIALGATILPLAGCESLAVDPVVRGMEFPFITPRESFFVQYGADGALAAWKGRQEIPRNTWRLTIDGLVENPLSLTFADLDADLEDIQTVLATLRCILDNNAVPGLIGTATWTGVPLQKFLKRAGVVVPDAQHQTNIRIGLLIAHRGGLTDSQLNLSVRERNEGILAALSLPCSTRTGERRFRGKT